MKIEFRRQKNLDASTQLMQQLSTGQLWHSSANKEQVEEHLFHFLNSVRYGRPQAMNPLLVEGKTLQSLYAHPHPDLVMVLCYCLDQFLVELGPNASDWGITDLPSSVLGFALAIYNCLAPFSVHARNVDDPIVPFVSALIQTLPPAQTLPEMLAYHSLLQNVVSTIPTLPQSRIPLMRALLDLSPLSALYNLHLYTPGPLNSFAVQLLPWWKHYKVEAGPWTNYDNWLDVVIPLFAQPTIAASLRQRWLSLPETRSSCRNVGLLMEMLRRRHDQYLRAFMLEFYESYVYFRAETVKENGHRPIRRWPILNTSERLLRANGSSKVAIEAAIHLNRIGNEYFLKFQPLLWLIIEEGGLPHSYNHLTLDFIQALRPLTKLTTENAMSDLKLDKIEFINKDI